MLDLREYPLLEAMFYVKFEFKLFWPALFTTTGTIFNFIIITQFMVISQQHWQHLNLSNKITKYARV